MGRRTARARRPHRVLEAGAYRARLDAAFAPGCRVRSISRKFRRRQILRIVVRDVLGLGTLPEITAELSALADAIVETAYQRIHGDLVRRYRSPETETAKHFAVIALGKLGGEELNYSSDID